MAKSASTILIRDTHRREHRRNMRRIVVASVFLWIALAIYLQDASGSSALVPLSITMFIGLALTRIGMWVRYRRDLRAELAAQAAAER